MPKSFPLTGTTKGRGGQFQIQLQYASWPRLFADEIFSPILRFRIKNLGPVFNGAMEASIAKFDKIEELPSVGNFTGPFISVFSKGISLKPGKTEDFKFKIESKHLSVGKFVVQILVSEKQPLNMMLLTESDQAILTLGQPKYSYALQKILDFRTLEVIKIHSWKEVLTAYLGVLGLLITIVTVVLNLVY
ncbi:MAG: hypothetical protein ACOYZ8_02160 [Chloroflexota bacterium]